jgi:hypothetical protein
MASDGEGNSQQGGQYYVVAWIVVPLVCVALLIALALCCRRRRGAPCCERYNPSTFQQPMYAMEENMYGAQSAGAMPAAFMTSSSMPARRPEHATNPPSQPQSTVAMYYAAPGTTLQPYGAYPPSPALPGADVGSTTAGLGYAYLVTGPSPAWSPMATA